MYEHKKATEEESSQEQVLRAIGYWVNPHSPRAKAKTYCGHVMIEE